MIVGVRKYLKVGSLFVLLTSEEIVQSPTGNRMSSVFDGFSQIDASHADNPLLLFLKITIKRQTFLSTGAILAAIASRRLMDKWPLRVLRNRG